MKLHIKVITVETYLSHEYARVIETYVLLHVFYLIHTLRLVL